MAPLLTFFTSVRQNGTMFQMKGKKGLFRNKKILKDAFFVCLALFFLGSGAFFVWIANLQTPNLKSFNERRVSQSTKIYDKTGEILLYDVHQDVKRTIIPLSDISRNIRNATIAIEDAEFYQHGGIKLSSIFRAVLANFVTLKFDQGGSTITQQVIKNSILTTDKKISRKLKEWVLALKLEKVYDKDTILAFYLNESPYGGSIYGVAEASDAFFGKKASSVTLAEAAYIASLPNAPTYYSPYGNNREKLEERKNLVLKRMLENKFVTEEEYTKALAEVVAFKPQEEKGIKAPHFVLFVKEYLENKYGETIIRDGGLKVTTTLDYNLQEKAEALAKKYALENKEKFNAENAAIVAIDPKTGGIITMVGSRDYFDKEIDGNFNGVLAHRQPRSAFKPFVYATAFRKGYTPDTVVFDLSTEFSTECNPDGTPIVSGNEDKCYKPENYDGIYRGPITLRNALAQSINIPAIETLYLAGLNDSLDTARDMGITSLTNVNDYGLTLVLGGGEVSPLDLTSAYGAFANEGVRNPYRSIVQIEDSKGNILEKFKPEPEEVLQKDIALQISDILSDNAARAPTFGANSALYFGNREVAVKTGTTNDYKDAWIVGYTPSIAVGAWAGNNDNTPMEKKVAGFIIAPLWHAFMDEVLKVYPEEVFQKPEEKDLSTLKPVLRGFWQGNQSYMVDKTTGKLATEFTPPEVREERIVKDVHTILYWLDKKDPQGPRPEHPENDSQFNLWEYAVQQWVKENNIQNETASVIPVLTDDVHRPEFAPVVKIVSPSTGISYQNDGRITVSLSAVGRFPLSKADIFINEEYVGTALPPSFSFSFSPQTLPFIKKENVLKIIGYDSVMNRGETTPTILISF